MDKQDLYMLKTLIHEYGGHRTLHALAAALKACADDFSDMGLKERATEAAEAAEVAQAAISAALIRQGTISG